jgi:alkanesulfonate monooxygenase SsuD/methylene tetrahydromethanopterin reductase-like flavin-dependent oxidoreductase (luciferase family)
LTTTATVLSVLDPVRVYQDFATLDLVSHGRAEIIAGRSVFAEPFALFGEDIGQLDDLYAEKLDLLLRLRDEERVTWTGRSGRRCTMPLRTRSRSARCPSGSPSAAPSTTPNGSSTSTGPPAATPAIPTSS